MLRELMQDIESEEQVSREARVTEQADTDRLLDELVEIYREREDVEGTVRLLSEQLLRYCDYHPI